jgi:NCS1 family nucleobase:cation symporter-1
VIVLATLNTNVAANVVSPSNGFSSLNPCRISFRTGGLITGIIRLLIMPWKLLSDYQTYIFKWLVGYSALLGPVAGHHDRGLLPDSPEDAASRRSL